MPIRKRIRFIFRFLIAYAQRHARFILVSFIGGFFFFFSIFRITPILGQTLLPEVKRVGIVGRYDPNTLPIPVQRLISTGLTEVSESGEPKPGLAKRWELSSDGKTYTFYLFDNLVWHDGQEFSAKDINYTIKDTTITPIDDSTVQIKLKEPFVPLPILLSRPLIRQGLVGLGSYKATSVSLKGGRIESLKLTPNTNNLPRIELKFYLTEPQAKLAFKLGEIDILEDLTDTDEFDDWNNVSVTHRIDHTRFVALFYNLQNDILKDKSVRQALSFSVPALEYERAISPISPLSWAYSNRVRQYKYDMTAAQRLVGNEKGKTGTASASLTISTFTPYLQLAKRIGESWQALGFSVNVKVVNAIPSDYQILLAAQEMPPDPDQYPMWHSTQVDTNITKLNNQKIDKLLEDGRITTNKEERLRLYQDFQRYLVDESPATFLYYPSVYTITRK